jgi:F-box and WD-40 domain protein 1/11
MKTHKCLRVIGIPTALQNDRTHRATPNPNCTLPTLSDTSKMKCNPNDPGEPDPSIYHTPRVFHDASILCLQLDDEIAITGSSDSTLLVWDVKTWEPIRRLVKHTAGVLDVAFDNEKIVSCSKDSTLCIWDRATGRLLEQIAAHRGPVNAVQLRGQLVVSASGEGCARLWNLNYISRINPFTQQHEARAKAVQVQEFWSKERGLACIEFSDDGACVLAGGNDMQIFKYDARSGQLLKEMKAHSNLVRSLYLDEASGRIISGSYDSVIRVWDLDSGKMKGEIAGWTGSWMLSAKSDFRRIVATSQDSRALVLDFGAGVDGVEALEEGGSV